MPFNNFTLSSIDMTGVYQSSVAWGDYDKDGDLDILLTGKDGSNNPVAKVYRNDSGTFTDIGASLTGVYGGSAAWGDYDNDGDLDILLTGMEVCKVYRNDSGTFTDAGANLINSYLGTGSLAIDAAWGDYDSDGDLDIVITAKMTGAIFGNMTRLYRNDSGTFTSINASLTPVSRGSAAWGDYDNDGDLDILLTGQENSLQVVTKVYRNDSGTFTNIGASLTGVYGGSAAWGDYDNDGDLDILLTGGSGSGYVAKIYRNDSGTFTDISASLTGVYGGSAAWGDYDKDGDLDILLTGEDGSYNPVAKVYRNDSGTFTDIGASLTGVSNGSVAWGDCDNDGDLDILLTGEDNLHNPVAKVYRNDSGTFTDVSANGAGVPTIPAPATLPGAGTPTIPPPATLPGTGTDIPTTGSILTDTTVTDSAGDDTITGNASDNNLTGGTDNDILCGDTGNDTVSGGDGNDLLFGGKGNDILDGGLGEDTLYGGQENDSLLGGAGNDIICGDTDNDTVNGGDGDDSIFGNKGDDLLDGGTGNDILCGGKDSDTLIGNTGNDILSGDIGNDTVSGGDGNDLLFGGKGDDTLDGGTGNDTLYGGKDADNLTGGDGDDWISGDLGNDTLTGGDGSDYFVFDTGAAFTATTADLDIIADFAADTDKIVLDKTTFTALIIAAGSEFSLAAEFATVTTDAAAGISAASIVYNSVSGKLFYNQNGTDAGFGTGDQFATLAGAPALAAADFLIQV
jgi:Ca2+-binding RTX toxin-like protein